MPAPTYDQSTADRPKFTRRTAIAATAAATTAAVAGPQTAHAVAEASGAIQAPPAVATLLSITSAAPFEVGRRPIPCRSICPEALERIVQLDDELRAAASPAAYAMHGELLELHLEDYTHSHERMIEELARHLPGLAPAIRAVVDHLWEQPGADVGVCCAE